MPRTISSRNLFSPSATASSSGMSSSSAAVSGGSTSRESQPPPSDQNNNNNNNNNNNENTSRVAKLIAENAIVVVAMRGCYMCLSVKRLLEELGVNPTLFEVDEAEKATLLEDLSRIDGGDGGGPVELPAVYVGGKLLGGVKKVIDTHIKGELVPMLKEAGALWL